jgi:hypothetical protein
MTSCSAAGHRWPARRCRGPVAPVRRAGLNRDQTTPPAAPEIATVSPGTSSARTAAYAVAPATKPEPATSPGTPRLGRQLICRHRDVVGVAGSAHGTRSPHRLRQSRRRFSSTPSHQVAALTRGKVAECVRAPLRITASLGLIRLPSLDQNLAGTGTGRGVTHLGRRRCVQSNCTGLP